jgi:hypothetical protein
MAQMVMSKLNVIAPMKLRRTERTFRKWSDCHRKLPAYINLYTTSFEFCDVRKCDLNDRTNERTNDKQISNALAKIHKSRGDLARVKTVNVVKNRWLPSLRSAAIIGRVHCSETTLLLNILTNVVCRSCRDKNAALV